MRWMRSSSGAAQPWKGCCTGCAENYSRAPAARQRHCSKYGLALDFYRKAGDRRGIATTLHSQARIHITQAAWNKTESLLQRALSIRLWLTDRSGTLAVVEDLIRLYQHTDQQAKLDEMEAWRGRLQAE